MLCFLLLIIIIKYYYLYYEKAHLRVRRKMRIHPNGSIRILILLLFIHTFALLFIPAGTLKARRRPFWFLLLVPLIILLH